ncbi:MAG: tetratricopeptide repeat protein [Spirochaetia bacterium]|nr:tetratricopeptide repeat protein [Spirochaetia bacterium]
MLDGRERACPIYGALLLLALLATGAVLLVSCTLKNQSLEAYSKALSAYKAGRLATAADGARAALAFDDGFTPAMMLLGKTSYFLDHDEAAIKAFRKALAHTPRAGEAALWLARSYRARGQKDDAQSICELLLSSNPVDIAALRLAAQLAIDKNDSRAARAFLDRAIESAAEAGLSYIDRAALLWAAKDREAALADLRAALVTLPSGSMAFSSASSLLAELEGVSP